MFIMSIGLYNTGNNTIPTVLVFGWDDGPPPNPDRRIYTRSKIEDIYYNIPERKLPFFMKFQAHISYFLLLCSHQVGANKKHTLELLKVKKSVFIS